MWIRDGTLGERVGTLSEPCLNPAGTLRGLCGDTLGTLWEPRGDPVGTPWGPWLNPMGTPCEFSKQCEAVHSGEPQVHRMHTPAQPPVNLRSAIGELQGDRTGRLVASSEDNRRTIMIPPGNLTFPLCEP